MQMPTLSADKPDKNALQMVIHNPNDNAATVVDRGRRGEGGRGLQALTRQTILKSFAYAHTAYSPTPPTPPLSLATSASTSSLVASHNLQPNVANLAVLRLKCY